MYKLFYYPRNASWAPHLVLAEMGVEFELVLVDRKSNEQKSSEYLALNPTGRIPTLIDRELVIFESAAICLHLCEKHPESGLIPELGSPLRAKFYQWLFYLNSTVQPELMIYFYPQKHTAGHDVKSIVIAQELRVTEMFSLLDKEIEGKSFLVGSSISVCDYFLFMLCHWASRFSQPPLSFGNLGRYLRGIAKREAVVAVCKIEGTSLELYQ
ncbi:MAG: glutathione S-transferase family protein [Pseudomonadota bacterium]